MYSVPRPYNCRVASSVESVVLLVPAAGHGRRLGLATHKAAVDIGGQPVGRHLLGAATRAGITEQWLIVRRGDGDLAERLGVPTARTHEIEPTANVPETVARGLSAIGDPAAIALGFPDVLYEPAGALTALLAEFRRRPGVDVLLGLFPTDRPDKADMVECAGDVVTRIRVKPGPCELTRTWLLALWRPAFSRFLVHHVAAGAFPPGREQQLSDVLNAAVAEGLGVAARDFPGGSHLDVGTPEDLARARRGRSGQPAATR
jgi:glucose-1-phosphate thymidylyltransferase